MRTQQRTWKRGVGWDGYESWTLGQSAQLVLAFGSRDSLEESRLMREVQAAHPKAEIIGCSTAGEIRGAEVVDNSLVVTAVEFNGTRIATAEASLTKPTESAAVGQRLAAALAGDDLSHVLVISDGLLVNGSELSKGLMSGLPTHVAVTGGLAGDGAKFEQTRVYYHGQTHSGSVVAIGMYGDRLRAGYSSMGGWDAFGPERLITRSDGNVLYELDGESALALYKRYLGPHAAGLPASGLQFPLSMRSDPSGRAVVRTILAINESRQSMTFAGDVPQGMYARLMRTTFDRLIDAATVAARASREAIAPATPELAVLISCVGRKLVLRQRIEEEVEGVRAELGERARLSGFYSYGELCPFARNSRCELHNQTMTITVFSEAA